MLCWVCDRVFASMGFATDRSVALIQRLVHLVQGGLVGSILACWCSGC